MGRRRSNTKRCLLCLEHISATGDLKIANPPESSRPFEMPGAHYCHQLEKQMEKVFIIRKILEIPESWCVEVLKLYAEEASNNKGGNGGSNDKNPANWFDVCCKCMDTTVANIWRIYQQIVALEVKMREMKVHVKERMQEELRRSDKRSWALKQLERRDERGQNNCGGGVEGRIISYMFPEFIVPKQEGDWIATEEEEIQVDGFLDSFEANGGDDDNWSDNYHSETEFKSTNAKHKKKLLKGTPKRKEGEKRKYRPRTKIVRWHRCLDTKCKGTFRVRKELDAHMKVHEQREKNGVTEKRELDCHLCIFPAREKEELERHIRSRHKLARKRPYHFSCPKCEFKVSDDFESLKAHFNQSHPIEGDPEILASEQPVKCEFCPKVIGSLKALGVHQRSVHPEQIGLQVEILECDQCGMKFSTVLELQVHMNKHIRQSKFICEDCGKGFQQHCNFLRHQITHQESETRERKYACNLCGLEYVRKWLLTKHTRKFHPTAEEEPKDEGGGGTDNANNLSRDVETNKLVSCKYCDFTCGIKGIMIRHLQKHKEESGYKCEECSKCYMNEAGLRRHVKIIHSVESAAVPCPHCLKPFNSDEYMRHHVRTACKIKKLEDPLQS